MESQPSGSLPSPVFVNTMVSGVGDPESAWKGIGWGSIVAGAVATRCLYAIQRGNKSLRSLAVHRPQVHYCQDYQGFDHFRTDI